ncbi:hypothetical protein ACVV2G_27490 [Streptomyces ziwulingensis]
MGANPCPGVLADLLHLLGVLDADLAGRLDSTLLPLGLARTVLQATVGSRGQLPG